MKTYAVTLNPESPFGTPLKGDTLFGHFCWQAAYDESLLHGGLDHWIANYPDRPFAVFASAWPMLLEEGGKRKIYCLPRPNMPVTFPATVSKKERAERRKSDKAKKWLIVPQEFLADLASCSPASDKEVAARHLATLSNDEQKALWNLPEEQRRPLTQAAHAHNTISRQTMTTGTDFAPFTMENHFYLPGLKLVLFVAVDTEAMGKDELCRGLENIGRFGFGRDASTGLGRFSVADLEEVEWPLGSAEGCYTLSPCVPETDCYSEQYAMPFTRFGKHGDQLVLSKNPFKNPVVMADEGSVFFAKENIPQQRPYIGKAVGGISLAQPAAVTQGYSLFLPYSRSAS